MYANSFEPVHTKYPGSFNIRNLSIKPSPYKYLIKSQLPKSKPDSTKGINNYLLIVKEILFFAHLKFNVKRLHHKHSGITFAITEETYSLSFVGQDSQKIIAKHFHCRKQQGSK